MHSLSFMRRYYNITKTKDTVLCFVFSIGQVVIRKEKAICDSTSRIITGGEGGMKKGL